jgi:putative transposase
MKKKRFTEEQIVSILKKVEAGKTVAEVCREHGVSEQSYYRWRRKYEGMQVQELKRMKELEKQNVRLKRLLAERDLELDAMREWVSKNV